MNFLRKPTSRLLALLKYLKRILLKLKLLHLNHFKAKVRKLAIKNKDFEFPSQKELKLSHKAEEKEEYRLCQKIENLSDSVKKLKIRKQHSKSKKRKTAQEKP